ncbi:MAG: response regulator [Synechococcus sp.]|nr:response regulator [Synechococcus sp.]
MTTNVSILIVDDEPNNFDVIEGFLQRETYELYYAANGADALKFLEDLEPDIILLDVMMPVMDGIELCKRIRDRPRWAMIPIIMITALTSKQDLALCLEAGADDFIDKPVNRLELIARIKSMLRIRQQYYQLKAFSKLQRDTINFLGRNVKTVAGQMGSGLSQKIDNPLREILYHLEYLNQNFDHINRDEVLSHLQAAEQSAYHLQTINRKFLIYTQLENLQENILPEQITQVKAITETSIIQGLRQLATYYRRQADLVIDLHNLDVALEPDYILVVLQELCDNAFKFSAPGTPVTVSSCLQGDQIRFCVEDQGVAFESGRVEGIYRYFRLTRQVFDQEGIGLGFALIRKIVTLANGYLQIDEKTNCGKKICLYLPRA